MQPKAKSRPAAISSRDEPPQRLQQNKPYLDDEEFMAPSRFRPSADYKEEISSMPTTSAGSRFGHDRPHLEQSSHPTGATQSLDDDASGSSDEDPPKSIRQQSASASRPSGGQEDDEEDDDDDDQDYSDSAEPLGGDARHHMLIESLASANREQSNAWHRELEQRLNTKNEQRLLSPPPPPTALVTAGASNFGSEQTSRRGEADEVTRGAPDSSESEGDASTLKAANDK